MAEGEPGEVLEPSWVEADGGVWGAPYAWYVLYEH